MNEAERKEFAKAMAEMRAAKSRGGADLTADLSAAAAEARAGAKAAEAAASKALEVLGLAKDAVHMSAAEATRAWLGSDLANARLAA